MTNLKNLDVFCSFLGFTKRPFFLSIRILTGPPVGLPGDPTGLEVYNAIQATFDCLVESSSTATKKPGAVAENFAENSFARASRIACFAANGV